MNHRLRFRALALLCISSCVAAPASAQSLEDRWKKEFPKAVSWYVRTSPGILLVKAGKSLTAIDGVDGRQLWELPEVEPSRLTLGDSSEEFQRGKNLLEVPGMGVLLLNRAKLPGDSDGRLIALNLMTGERLWDLPQIENLMTVVPLEDSRQIVLVSRRLQGKAYAKKAALTALAGMAFIPLPAPYPFRFEFLRRDLLTGKILWKSEFPQTFDPSPQSVNVIGDHLYVYVGNRVLGCMNLVDGTVCGKTATDCGALQAFHCGWKWQMTG
jgi:hypothetical protein